MSSAGAELLQLPRVLQQVPEEDSKAVLSMQASREHLSGPPLEQQKDINKAEDAAATVFVAESGRVAVEGSEQQLLQSELQQTMQLFQQRLQQTALMAQQLLAHQVAGQAARCSGSRPGSVQNSRPGSAAAAQKHTSSNAQGAAAQLKGGLAGSASGGSSSSGGSGLRLTPRLAALGVDEPPSAAEVAEYAAYLGMDPQQDAGLLYIAELALTAPCPDGWTVHLDNDGNEFFYNPTTQASTYEHPMDQHYRDMYQQKKQEQQQQRQQSQPC